MLNIKKTSKRQTLLLSVFLLVLVAAALTNHASAAALFQWHPLSEISADGGATSIATASGKLDSGIFEGPITTSATGPVDISVDTNIAGVTTANGNIIANSALTANGPIDLIGAVTVNNDMDLNSNKIINLANPTANTDAATKEYVDAAGGSSGYGLCYVINSGTDEDCDIGFEAVITSKGTGCLYDDGRIFAVGGSEFWRITRSGGYSRDCYGVSDTCYYENLYRVFGETAYLVGKQLCNHEYGNKASTLAVCCK